MSSEASTTEATEGAEDQSPKQPPQGNFDDKGKFVRVKGVKYAASTQALITRYNDIIDNLALFGEPAVAKHVLNAADISDKPAAIQNLAESLRKLLKDVLEESKKNDREGADAALTALRTQLTEEYDDSLAQLRDEHDQKRTSAEAQHREELNGKNVRIASLNDQLDMCRRLGIYQLDVLDAVNAFLRLINGEQIAPVGITPLGIDKNTGDTVERRFEVADLLFTVTTCSPNAIGNLMDFVTVGSARKSALPKLVTKVLDVRTDGNNPGLNSIGHDTLCAILRKMTHNWFRQVATDLTDEEISQTFEDPSDVRALAPSHKSGLSLFDLLSASEGHTTDDGEHDATTCPACQMFLKIAGGGIGGGVPDEFNLLSFGPLGKRLITASGLKSYRDARRRREAGEDC